MVMFFHDTMDGSEILHQLKTVVYPCLPQHHQLIEWEAPLKKQRQIRLVLGYKWNITTIVHDSIS